MVHPQIPVRRTRVTVLVPVTTLLALLASCGDNAPSPSAPPPRTSAAQPSPARPPPGPPAPSPGRPGPPRGDLPKVSTINRSDPDAVGAAFIRLAWTSDTRLDTTPMDAGRRAAALAVPALARSLRTASSAADPGADWQTWAQHHAYTRVQLQPNPDSGAPGDTPTDADRSWKVRITPVGDGHWRGTPSTLVVYLALTRSGSAWAVSDLKVAR